MAAAVKLILEFPKASPKLVPEKEKPRPLPKYPENQHWQKDTEAAVKTLAVPIAEDQDKSRFEALSPRIVKLPVIVWLAPKTNRLLTAAVPFLVKLLKVLTPEMVTVPALLRTTLL